MDAEFEDLAVLVVDDDRASRALTMSLCESIGAVEVQQARSGFEALELLRRFTPDIIISDLVMEEMDGIGFTRRIRSHPESPNPYVPIILLTGHADRRTVFEARDAGVNAFLAKPVSMNSLQKKIAVVLAEPREFIRTEDYVGPDRRRQDRPLDGRLDRRRED
ncbi:MAG: response regulator [Alphaproteobacteria bacterium]|nr:response regulator [Alphaproteobacteria bacterium]